MAYVDTEKLKRNIRVNLMPNVDIDGTVAVENAERFFLDLIDKTSTADVVELRHGEWINVPPYRALSGEYLKGQECSVCHSFFVSEGNTPYSNHPYCCECGAKMDGGRKNDGKG